MWIIIGCIAAFVIIASWILPWVNHARIRELQRQIAELHRANPPAALEAPPKIETAPPVTAFTVPVRKPVHIPPAVKPAPKARKQFSFEQVFGARLPVWIGGIALILAGFFMVKYSIETGLVTERVRVIMGLLFGLGLVSSGNWLRGRPNFANGEKISQALTGAGIAVLYLSIYAATSLYHLVPLLAGFLGMAAVTAAAVILSLRHGAPIALLGLVGGFLTPAIIGSHGADAPLLFMYLYFVLSGLLLVIRKQNWWLMAFPTMLGAFAWVTLWLLTDFTPDDAIYLGLFVIAISATLVMISRQNFVGEESTALFTRRSVLNYLSLGGAFVMMAIISGEGEYGIMQWAMYGVLSLGGIVMAYFKPKLYGFVPATSMAVNAVMLASWNIHDPSLFAVILAAFALMYIACGYILMWKSTRPEAWAGLSVATALGYYLLAYLSLHDTALFQTVPLFWGFLALALCGAAITAIYNVQVNFVADEKIKQRLLAIFAAAASAFLAIALTIELKREFLSVALAAEVFALAWINSKVEIRALRHIAGVVALAFGVLLLPQLVLLLQLTVYSLTEQELHLQHNIPLVNWPLFQLGVPAVLFSLASRLLRQEKDDRLVYILEVASVALLGIMGYYLTRHAFHVNEDVLFVKATFIERGVITNILYVYGLACIFLGRNFKRQAVLTCGVVLCGVALFRICFFDLLIANPIWVHDSVGLLPLINGLLLTYGIPAIWSYLAAWQLHKAGKIMIAKYFNIAILIFAFAFVSFTIRQWFQGAYLDSNLTTNAETYSYSIAWLLLGGVLLFLGALKKDQAIRIASLVLMLLTIGKVFLYDAAELRGLYRVFSFFGLGLSLMAISWFYTRFVFNNKLVAGRDEV